MMAALLVTGLLAGQDTLSLDQALARALAARGEPVSIQAAMDQARALHRLAGTVPNPIVSYSQTESPPRRHATLDQPLAWLLTRGTDRSAGRAELLAVEQDSLQRVAALGREVRVAFYGVLAAEESRRLIDGQAAVADSLAALAAARFRAGDISAFERDQIALEAGLVRQAASLAHQATLQARAEFVRSIAWQGTPPELRGELDHGLDAVPPDTAGAVDDLPMVARATADSVAARLRWRSTRLGRIPFPSFQAGLEWSDPSMPGQALRVVGLSMPLPIWHQGGGADALAASQAREAAAQLIETRLEGARLLSSARARLLETTWRARFSRDSLLPAAQTLRERAVQAYEAGETSVLPVLDALRRERETGVSVAAALLEYQTALAGWLELWGREE